MPDLCHGDALSEPEQPQRQFYRITYRCKHTHNCLFVGTEAERQAEVKRHQALECFYCEFGLSRTAERSAVLDDERL